MPEFSGDRVPKAAVDATENAAEKRVISSPLLGFMEESERMKMNAPEFNETHQAKVLGIKNVEFKLSAGPLDPTSTHASGKRVLEEGEEAAPWYVLQIEYGGADALKDKLPLGGWASGSAGELARAANKIAQEFCDKNGFTPVVHVNSWPDFKALIYKDEPIPTFASEEEEEEWHAERMREIAERDIEEES